MSAYLNAVTIAANIASLTISGVTIKALTAIPERVEARDCPVLYPKPDGFITNLVVDRVTFGTSMDARKTITYNMTYRYLHTSIGVERGLFAVYDAIIGKVDNIVSAIVDNDALSGTIDITPLGIEAIGPVTDPAGNVFHGCDLTFGITVFVR